MIDLTTINEWQKYDEATGCVFPWYTFPALDEINTWDLSDKTVLEIGGGASTVWWNLKAKKVFTYEDNHEYREELRKHWFVAHTDLLDELPYPVDIAIVDNDGDRSGMIKAACSRLKTGPGSILIVDNWDQPSIDWQPSEEMKQVLLSKKHKIFKQPNHPDWQTIIIWL